MKKYDLKSSFVGGIVGSVVIVIVLMVINQFVPLKAQDMLSFIILAVSIVIAAFTILGAATLFTSWNDIDERAEKSLGKYEMRAKEEIDRYGTGTRQEIIQDINQRQEKLNEVTQQYMDRLNETAKKALQNQKKMLAFSLIVIGGAMIGTYLRQKFPPERVRKWVNRSHE